MKRIVVTVFAAIAVLSACQKPVEPTVDYIDEYGINHGKGIKIGGTVWAPVNCGFHATDYQYGKLYQWGRKYGQGYDGNDASTPEMKDGGVSVSIGNDKGNANVFYTDTQESNGDWIYPWDWSNNKLWSPSQASPVKTNYDPCPDGWRVPMYRELIELCQNSLWGVDEKGQNGRWFSGASPYSKDVAQVFFPAAGYRDGKGDARDRGNKGYYWPSWPDQDNDGLEDFLFLHSDDAFVGKSYGRTRGYSVRCVQE